MFYDNIKHGFAFFLSKTLIKLSVFTSVFRFVYGMAGDERALFLKLVKLNVETKEFVTWEESGGFTSEPVFVKAPDGKVEDDGVVLSCVINPSRDQTTSLLVLGAKEFKELGRAVVQGVVPATLHGIFQ